MTVLDAEAWASDGGYAEAVPDQIGRDVLARLREASAITPAALSAAREHAATWRAALSSLWERVNLLALPTLLGFPPTLDNSREMLRIRGLTSPSTWPGAGAGPAGAAGGPLPASIQLIGPAGGEESLLTAGAILERPRGFCPDHWSHRRWPYRLGLIAQRIPRMTMSPAGRTSPLGERQGTASRAGGGPSREAARWPRRPAPRTAPGRPAAAAG